MALTAGRRSFNGRIREYFLDVAGVQTISFGDMGEYFDDSPLLFGSDTGDHSLNDAMRLGLNQLGYGPNNDQFDGIGAFFNEYDGWFQQNSALTHMLKLWANDVYGGGAAEDFDKIGDTFDGFNLYFGNKALSVNTALRLAVATSIASHYPIDLISWAFNLIPDSFDAIDEGYSIEGMFDEFAGTFTFDSPVGSAFEEIAAVFESIMAEFSGDNDTEVGTTWDRERRMWNLLN